MSSEAGVGLKARKSSYDPSAADAIAGAISGRDSIGEGIDAAKNDILLQSQKTADRTMQMNAEFQSRAGMQVLVSREYDNVGVHTTDKGGKDDCQWCMSRCGSDVPYQEAYAKGMFERHPGCGCVITYKSARDTFTQGKGQWESNNWEQARERRIAFSNKPAFGVPYYQRTANMPPEEYAIAKRLWYTVDEIDIPQSEREYVYEELDNNLSVEERESAIVTRDIGNYRYRAINLGHNQYKIYGKEPIEKYDDWMDEVMSEVIGPDWKKYDK